jgi:release factor glutamine methyltransferase
VSGPLTVSELRREIAASLAATSPTAALDARLLVAHALGIAADDVIFQDEEPAGGVAMLRARNLAHRRAIGEPVARIVGEKEFYGLTLALSPETLVPRPDTETLVDAVLDIVDHGSPVAILDLGTGSGAILLALLTQLPEAAGLGVDLSKGAVATAEANARRFGLSDRAVFAAGNWAAGIEQKFAVVVANPPYIATADIAGLPVEVRAHDPHLALDGGSDGLDAVRAILSDLDRVLAEGGAAFIEIGFGQALAVNDLAAAKGFTAIFRRDLAGVERVVVISRQNAAPLPGG